MTILDMSMNAETEMRFSSLPRLTLENVCLKCCLRTKETDTQALSDRISELEKKLERISEQIASGLLQPSPDPTADKAVQTAKKAPAGAKKETVSAAKPGPADVQSVWKEAMSRLSKTDPRIWGILTQGSISCEGTEIRWSPLKAEGSEYFVAPLTREEKKQEILQVLREITGNEYSFAASARTENQTAQSNKESAYINSLYETFGKEPVDIVDHL